MRKVSGLYNKVWQEEKLPGSGKQAVVVPIRKPGKDPTSPSSYRPIALTSYVCKLMERMITERLTYFLESGGLSHQIKMGSEKAGEQWILYCALSQSYGRHRPIIRRW